MKDILRLLIIALIGYGLYSHFMAREAVDVDPGDLEENSAARCLERLSRAGELFESAISQFSSPPIDRDAWQDEYAAVEQAQDLAEGACQCPEEACDKAREGIRQLTLLTLSYDNGFNSGSGPPVNAAARIDQFQRTLEAARALAR